MLWSLQKRLQRKKMFKKILIILILAFSINMQDCFADKINLKNGKSYKGVVLEETQDSVKMYSKGIILEYFQDEIERVEIDRKNNFQEKNDLELIYLKYLYAVKKAVQTKNVEEFFSFITKEEQESTLQFLEEYKNSKTETEDSFYDGLAWDYLIEVNVGKQIIKRDKGLLVLDAFNDFDAVFNQGSNPLNNQAYTKKFRYRRYVRVFYQ